MTCVNCLENITKTEIKYIIKLNRLCFDLDTKVDDKNKKKANDEWRLIVPVVWFDYDAIQLIGNNN